MPRQPDVDGRPRPDVLLEQASDLLTLHDASGRVLYANAACRRVLGLLPEQLVGSDPWPLVHPDDRPHLVERMLELRERTGEVHVFSVRARHTDGSYRQLEALARNGLEDPELGCILLSTRDVTDRERAEQALAQAGALYRRITETAPVGLAVVDDEQRVRWANPAALALTGQADGDAVLGQRVQDLVVPEDRERCRAALQAVLDTRTATSPTDYRLLRPDGQEMVVSSAPQAYDWEGGPAVLLVLQDVTSLHRAEADRARATDRFRLLLDATEEGVLGLDTSGRITFVNPAAARVLQLDPGAALGQPSHPLIHHSRPDGTPYPEVDCPCLAAARYGRPARVEGEVFWAQDGTAVPVEYRATPLRTDTPSGAVLTFHDVSERQRSRERLRRVAEFQSAVLNSLPALTAVVDRRGVIVAVNAAWTEHMLAGGGRPQDCGVGVDYLAVCDAAKDVPDAQLAATGLRAVLAGQSDAHAADIACTGPDGTVQYFSLTMVPLHTPEGGAVISYADITERKLLEMAVAYRATHDVLTGLANRTLLLERLEHALTARSAGVALLFLDLDHFKLVNDGYGHEAGDRVLLELASRLRRHVRPFDTVARLAGDEFVVLCEGPSPVSEAYLLAERLVAEVSEPFLVGGGNQLPIGVSIGVAVAGDPAPSPDDLLRAADQAMLDAKTRGRNRVVVYDADVHGSHHVRFEQAMALRRLLEDSKLLVHYQPVIDLRDGSVTGAEALLRWHGEDLLPDTATAIALAEEIGLIGSIGRFVLGEATRQAATFVLADGSLLPLAVNLAPEQLERRLVQDVEEAAERAGYPLTSMTLELTEHSVMAHPALAVEVLGALRKRGVRIALDDFGVGYSSLAYLRDLPLDVLKIDMGFVKSLVGPDPDLRIIRAIIQMGRALDLDIVAEGVEREDQRDRLLELGCRLGQGFLWSRARPARALRALSR